MSKLSLTAWQRRRVRRHLECVTDAHTYRRTLALLEVHQGRPIAEVARMLGVTRQSIYNWIEAYSQEYNPTVLRDALRSGRPSLWTEDSQSLLRELLTTSPDRLGYFAVNWTVPLLREQLEHRTGQRLCDDTIRGQLHRMGYVWKRSRYVLDPDPEREKKAPDPPKNQAIAAPERGVGRG
jgi:transposase